MKTTTPRKKTELVLPEVTLSEDSEVRYLHLGSEWIQGTMLLKDPIDIELEYVQRMMAWLLFAPIEHVTRLRSLQLGLGAATLTKFCYKRLRMRTDAIELNPQVIAVCRQWFKLPADGPRLHVHQADAGQAITESLWLDQIDALQVDLYDAEAAAPVLDSPDFYMHCRRTLTDQGCMSVNLFGRDVSFDVSVERIASVFGRDAVWCFKPTREGNAIVLALRQAQHPSRLELLERAQLIESRWSLPAVKWLKTLKPLSAV